MSKRKIKVKFNFAYKKEFHCANCQKLIRKANSYYHFSMINNWDSVDYYFKICSNCLTKLLKDQEEYLKDGGFDKWLKEELVRRLQKK